MSCREIPSIPQAARCQKNAVRPSRGFALLCLISFLAIPSAQAQQRKVYEGVISVKKKTIGTVILVDTTGGTVSGWMRMEKFVKIDGGSVMDGAVEFQAGGNQYRIDERRGRIIYSGPDGEGNRFLEPMKPLAGKLQEVGESEKPGGSPVVKLELRGRNWNLEVGRPALWKNESAPFENFTRVEDMLGKDITVWIGETSPLRGRMVVIEEPSGMDIPLKPTKESKKDEKEKKT